MTDSGSTYSPTAITYSGNNRTHMIRIPDKGRFEFRVADGAVNPYLLQASLAAMGINGMEKIFGLAKGLMSICILRVKNIRT